MSSESSTDTGRSRQGFHARHLFALLALAAATWAVIAARDTHPVALLLLSAAVLAAGVTGAAVHEALMGFLGAESVPDLALSSRDRRHLEEDKALVLRSIKELEFDRSMGKVGDADFADVSQRLRARALSIMQELERQDAPPPVSAIAAPLQAGGEAVEPAPPPARFCAACGTPRDPDARFCKHCGARLA